MVTRKLTFVPITQIFYKTTVLLIGALLSGFLRTGTTFFFSETMTLRHHYQELSAYRKIRPRCWWGQSWIAPTSRPEYLLVNLKTILSTPQLKSSGSGLLTVLGDSERLWVK